MSYKRSQEQKRRDKKLYDLTKHWYFRGAWKDKRGVIKRAYPYKRNGVNMSKYYRKQTSRKLRRMKHEAFNNGDYRKVYDLWWTLF